MRFAWLDIYYAGISFRHLLIILPPTCHNSPAGRPVIIMVKYSQSTVNDPHLLWPKLVPGMGSHQSTTHSLTQGLQLNWPIVELIQFTPTHKWLMGSPEREMNPHSVSILQFPQHSFADFSQSVRNSKQIEFPIKVIVASFFFLCTPRQTKK